MILPELISQHAKISPDKPALFFKDEQISFKELNRRIEGVAAGLTHLGIRKGQALGLLLRNCPEFIVLTMALGKIGGVAVPINFLEKPEQIALILNDAKAVGLLTSRDFLGSALTAAQNVSSVKHIFIKDGETGDATDFRNLYVSPPAKSEAVVNEDDLLMLLYTSGTTGAPKGVMLSHRNFLANVEQCLSVIKVFDHDVFLCLLPMFHSFCWTTCVLIPLKKGIPAVIMESLLPFDPVIQSIWKHNVTIFIGVPQIFSALCQKISGAKAFLVRFLNPVRLCISGAAPLPAVVFNRFEKTFKVPLIEGYGLTETAPVCTLNPIDKRKVGTVGLPLRGVEVQIRNDDGKSVSQNEVGEIWIRGDNVMQGYFRRPKETADVLTPDGWLKTGDLGRIDAEGYLTIVDRKKDLIIIKGLNVYPQEVENIILKHPDINEVAVVGKMNPDTGEETIRAFVTLKEGTTFKKSELMNLLRDHLAPYKRPRDIIPIDIMPKNSLQKILKKELRER